VSGLRRANLVLAVLALLGPIAHVLELPNKLALKGALWLAIQQHLYRGWGPFLGAPAEIGAMATSLALVLLRRGQGPGERLRLVAAASYAGMIAVFFIFNAPVNAALRAWSPATLPGDWTSYRLRWETGHALAALLAVLGLVCVVRACIAEARNVEAWGARHRGDRGPDSPA
jgi:hypothetical protein